MINALGSGFGPVFFERSLWSLLDFGANRFLEDGEGRTAVELALQHQVKANGRLSSEPDSQWMRNLHLATAIQTLLNYTTVPVNAEIVPAFLSEMDSDVDSDVDSDADSDDW